MRGKEMHHGHAAHVGEAIDRPSEARQDHQQHQHQHRSTEGTETLDRQSDRQRGRQAGRRAQGEGAKGHATDQFRGSATAIGGSEQTQQHQQHQHRQHLHRQRQPDVCVSTHTHTFPRTRTTSTYCFRSHPFLLTPFIHSSLFPLSYPSTSIQQHPLRPHSTHTALAHLHQTAGLAGPFAVLSAAVDSRFLAPVLLPTAVRIVRTLPRVDDGSSPGRIRPLCRLL